MSTETSLRVCPKNGCDYEGSEHGVKVHWGRSNDHQGTLARTATCQVCERQFKVRDGRDAPKSCSILCREVYISNCSTRQELARRRHSRCGMCNTWFTDSPSAENEHCSRGCADEHRRETGVVKGSRHPRWVEKVEKSCPECDTTFMAQPSQSERRTFCSLECRGRYDSRERRGEAHPNWKGYEEAWKQIPIPSDLRNHILSRDSGECWFCGISNDVHMAIMSHGLHVHHVTPRSEYLSRDIPRAEAREKANRESNLITVCNVCHHE